MEREQTWIRAIQRRNSREAAEQLIQSYYAEIYRFVYRQIGSKEDAMDLPPVHLHRSPALSA